MDTAVASVASGFLEAVAVQPLDMIKVRQQINPTRNEGVLRTARSVVTEGGAMRFYRGASFEMASVVAGRATCWMCYETLRQRVARACGADRYPVAQSAVVGAAAAVPEAVVVTPFQVVKTRMQSQEHLARYASVRECVVETHRTEGVQGFGRGLRATVYRNAVWTGVYFASIAWVQALHLPDAISGFLAGAWAVLFNAPFDVVKSRQQNTLGPPQGVLSLLRHISATEGCTALYKGATPKVWRMGLGGAISLATFTSVKRLLGAGSSFDGIA
eukprot:TRINITY_DN25793_c0_g1_i1.p1 TRINITY_DN25793_c0_g1~~TRINITY_DN25793_c0_g1_i1.p1  ORF type:complete len:273 (+),score=40.59 TRINITY_DN25793_c0_g1_i1:76-894(+)